MGVATGKGLLAVVREHTGHGARCLRSAVLVVANTDDVCRARRRGDRRPAPGRDPAWLSVPVAVAAVSALVLLGSFHRVEHVLLRCRACSAPTDSGFLAGPDWGAAARGLVTPTMPLDRATIVLVVATR